MGIFRMKKKPEAAKRATAVQTGMSSRPFYQMNSFVPMSCENRIYRQLRESVPLIDAAIGKIVRLVEGFRFETGNIRLDSEMNAFFEHINVGGNQKGVTSFLSSYLDQLLTCGTAVGEMILQGGSMYALYNGELEALEVRRAQNGIDLEFFNGNSPIARPELLLYSVLNPRPGQLLGTSLLKGLPFLSDILMKIYHTMGENWEHAGNVRFAVTYRPAGDSGDSALALDRANQIAEAWKDAMSSGSVKDFVAVGDVDVKVIGADSVILDSEVPVRQILEQIVAKTGLPPYLFGLSWSTTERMSEQQADILTTELESYRRILTPVVKKIGKTYLALNGAFDPFEVVWDDITLQDQTELAKAELYYAQAEKIKKEMAQ